MTVRELIELNQMITDIEITVRKDGAMLDQLNIGPAQGEKPPYPTRIPKEEKYLKNYGLGDPHMYREAAYMPKSINSWDDDKDYWQIKVNRIPKAWLDLEVTSWEVWPASVVTYHSPRRQSGIARNVNFHGQRINIETIASGERLEVPEPKEKTDDQLEGQMRIEDWKYEVMKI